MISTTSTTSKEQELSPLLTILPRDTQQSQYNKTTYKQSLYSSHTASSPRHATNLVHICRRLAICLACLNSTPRRLFPRIGAATSPRNTKYANGKQLAINIYKLLDKDTTIDADRSGVELDTITGSMALEKVDFAYPTRPDIKMFKGIDIKIESSQTVALVGPSGCGKSTVIALLGRWYDTDGGKAVVENYDIRDLQLHNVRNHMALVGQEPVLINLSIKDNILYGLSDDIQGTMEQVEGAAKMANIYNFVTSLPLGYDTHNGNKGSQGIATG